MFVRATLVIVVLAALLGGTARPNDLSAAPVVVAVEFSPANQPLLDGHLRELVTVQEGAPFEPRRVRESIQKLFATGRYEPDIRVTQEDVPGGIKLTFHTTPSWFVGSVQVEGAPEPPTPLQLINAAQLDLGQAYVEEDIGFAIQEMARLLEDNGFFAVDITKTIDEHPETQQKDITFNIVPSARATVGNIILTPSKSGGAPLPEDEIRRITGWQRGKSFSQRGVAEGLRHLQQHFRDGQYWLSTVQISGTVLNHDTNEADLVVDIDRGPKVVVRVEGAEIGERKLRLYLPIYEEGVVDDDLLAEGARNLRNYYQSQGYFFATVNPVLERQREDEVLIIYEVDQGQRQELVHVGISGNHFFDLETVTERMLVQPKTLDLRRGRLTDSLLARDRLVILDLYGSNGFPNAEVACRKERDYRGHDTETAVFCDIHEGELTLVEELRIKGAEQLSEELFRSRLASVEGQPFSEVSVAADRDLILADYYDSGYHQADLSWTRLESEDPKRVVLEFEIHEGDTLYFGRPIVTGLRHTKQSLVDEQVQIRPGQPFAANAMFETQRRLYDLGIFSKVDVGLQNPKGDEPAKNVLIQVAEGRRWTARLGGGAEFARIGGNTGDVTSPVGNASFSPRVTLEVTRLNVRGIGHTMSVRTRFSNLQQRALFIYEAPRWTGSDKWDMTISGLLDTSRNVRTYSGSRLEGALQLRHRISKPSTALYRFTYRRTAIDQNTLQITPLLIPLTSQPVHVGLLSGTYIQDRRDDPTDSTRGIFNTVDLSLASRVWASEPDFVRFLGQNSTYHRLGSSRIVLARTLQLGLLLPTGTFSRAIDPTMVIPGTTNPDPRIPLAERFFAGGANSHRGFPVNQAGSRDPTTGFPIGGGAQFLNSVELRFPLRWENIGGVLFHDAGNVFSRPREINFRSSQREIASDGNVVGYNFDYLVHAAGLGVRYKTPIGPLRFDIAYSLNPPRFLGFEGTREDLLLGRGMLTQQRISHYQFHFSLGQTF
ncbi:MAG: BamA/TamA family outer membrane protein [Acidobacteria bacterium]|nr:BamA/TamA family outer membrane protein [Acidobacteriota bacterium]